MALRIRVEHGQEAGKTYRLPVAGAYRLGRSPAASIQVLDMKVSKEHFEIVLRNGTSADATIRDLGSSHGTFLNGQKVEQSARPLVPGDEVRLGLTVLRALSDGPGDADAKPTGPVPADAAGATSTTSVAGATSGGGAAPAGGSPAGSRREAPAPAAGMSASGTHKVLPADALVGTTLSGYKILEKVGAGGMGAVYRAEQLSLHREVAIKVLAEKLVSDSAFVDQFVNEARAAGQLNHPNVVQVYDVGHADGRHFFSMEFIHGGPLESKITKTGGAKWQNVLPWFLDAANALIFAEKKGILHRDIKPDNFMVGQDGSVKLCDLGLAKKSESDDLLAQGIIGTPHFISPEAIRRKTDVDQRADLYSLGCTFYRVITGKNPYPLGSVKEILLAHLNAPPPRASGLVSDLPKELDEIVFRLMQKDPAARYQNSAELWQALDKVRLHFGMEAHGLHPGRAKKFAILGGVVAAAAIGVAVYIITHQDPPREITKDRFVADPEAAAKADKLRIANAKNAFGDIERKDIKADLEKTWRDGPTWDGIAEEYEALAKDPEHSQTEFKDKAQARAKEIRDNRATWAKREHDQKAKLDAAHEALNKVIFDTRAAVSKAVDEKSVPALLALDAILAKADAEIKSIGTRTGADGQPLVFEPKEIENKRSECIGLAAAALTALNDLWQARLDEAKAGEEKQTAEGYAAALAVYTEWLAGHPKPESTLWPLSKRLAEIDAVATEKKGLVEKAQEMAARLDRDADQKAFFTFLRDAHRPRPQAGEGMTGGWYAEFKFADGQAEAAKRATEGKTQAYRDRFGAATDDFQRVAKLPAALEKAVANKAYKGDVKGKGFSGPLQQVLPDGVQVKDKPRYFREEGIEFFLGLFYDDKGQERILLDADAHEALGLLAFAGGVAESAALFDRAIAEWEKAKAADAARADRIAKRAATVAEEKAARAALEYIQKTLDEQNDEMKRLEDEMNGQDPKVAAKARETVKARQGAIRQAINDARAKADDLQKNRAGTITWALLLDAKDGPPRNAAYGGEQVPPEPAPSATPTPTPGTTPGTGPGPTPIPGTTPPGDGAKTPPAPGVKPTEPIDPSMGGAERPPEPNNKPVPPEKPPVDKPPVPGR